MNQFPKRICVGVLVLALALTAGRGVVAQGAVTIKLDSIDTGQFPQLTVYATVIDENGLPVTHLAAEHFELVEDGRTSFPPDTVQAITNDKAAVSVLILIDLGGTMSGKPLQAAKEATSKFLEKLLNEGNDPDRAAFIGFGKQVDIKAVTLTEGPREVPFTNDTGRLLNVVNFVDAEKGTGTPLYDAIYRAVKIITQQPGRRAIIVMTDGSDVGSTLKEDDPINEARRQHIPIFPIGLSNSRLDKTYLSRLAELTGGQYQEAPTPDEIGQKFEQVLSQLKIQYQLTYQSRLAVDGQYHSLLLRVNTTRGQGFDEIKFQLGQPPTAVPSAPPPSAVGTPVPQATMTPTEGEQGMENIITWIQSHVALVAGIIAAALILLLLLIILVVVFLRRRAAAQVQPAWTGGEGYGAPAPGWSPIETTPGVPTVGTGLGVAPSTSAPTEMGASPTGAGTQLAAPPAPGGGGPFGPAAPPPPFSAPTPVIKPSAPEAPAAGGTVVIQRGPKPKVLGMLVDRKQPSRRFDFEKTVTIGRAPTNTIVLDHPTVSRQHATIKLEGAEFRLYDLGSANGTFVGDKRVREPITLQDGMTVRFGEVEFTYKRMSLE